jgi:hypothetical protein
VSKKNSIKIVFHFLFFELLPVNGLFTIASNNQALECRQSKKARKAIYEIVLLAGMLVFEIVC